VAPSQRRARVSPSLHLAPQLEADEFRVNAQDPGPDHAAGEADEQRRQGTCPEPAVAAVTAPSESPAKTAEPTSTAGPAPRCRCSSARSRRLELAVRISPVEERDVRLGRTGTRATCGHGTRESAEACARLS